MNDQDLPKDDADEWIARQLENLESRRKGSESASDESAKLDLSPDVAERLAAAAAALDLIHEVAGHDPRQAAMLETREGNSANAKTDPERADQAFAAERLQLDSIGGYEIVKQIGRGGYGVVLQAIDRQLNRTVALKIPRVDHALKPEMRARFAREARAAAALDHPNIVAVYDCGHDQGLDYLAVQFVDGDDLGSFLAKGNKLDPHAAARLVADLADALEHAHQRGVLHRDLKPGNVLLERIREGEQGDAESDSVTPNTAIPFIPRITDFGLASIQDEAQDFTQTGSVVGTPAYMSPEQARSRRELFGPPTDVYGLGTILYQLLTGDPPFRGETVLEIVRAVAERDPIAPRHADPTVPRDLEAVCLKCLEKDPARRYPTARELQADLNRFLSGRPVIARPVTAWNRTVRWAKRNPLVAGLGAAAAVFLVAALAATTIGWQSTRAALQRETRALEKETEARRQARSAVNQFYTEVAENDLLDVPGLTPLRHRMLQLALGYYQNLLAVSAPLPELLQDLELAHQRAGEILLELGEPTEALAHFEEALQLQEEQLATTPHDRQIRLRQSKTFREISSAHQELNRWDEARAAVQRSLDGLRELIQSDPQDQSAMFELARSLGSSAEIAKQKGDLNAASTDLLEAEGLIETMRLADPDDVKLKRMMATNLASQSNIAAKTGQLPKAAELTDQMIDVVRDLLSADQRNPKDMSLLAGALYDRARLWLAQRQPAKAIPLLEEACGIAGELCLLFPDVVAYHTRLATTTQGLAVAYMQMGQFELGVQAFRDNLASVERIAELVPDLLGAKMNLAQARLNLAGSLGQTGGAAQEILTLLTGAKTGFDEILAQDPQLLDACIGRALTIVNLASASNDDGLYDKALQYADQSLAALEELKAMVPEHPQVKMNEQMAWANRASALERLDRADEAIVSWQRAVSIPGPQPEAELRLRLAGALAMNDDPEEAKAQLEQAFSGQAGERWPYRTARARALLLGAWQRAGFDDAEAIEAMAAAAVANLETARVAGTFDRANRRQELLDSADFEPLRQRTDLQELLVRIQERHPGSED